MFRSPQKKQLISRNSKIAAASFAFMMCTACGGGSSTSSSTTTQAVVNQAPVAVASSKLSIVTEGQRFELDGSRSTDREGDNLSYSWRQLSGPQIEIGAAATETLSLVAPMLEGDQDVSFELTVSDGANTDVSLVSLKLENVNVDEVLSKTTEFGTGGPTNPVETVADPSVFEGRKPLVKLIGLTPEGDDGYRVHWTAASGGHDTPVSSQAFSLDGESVGAQTDGVFFGGARDLDNGDDSTFDGFFFGITFATIQSGDTVFNFNGEIELEFSETSRFNLKYTSHRGLVEGEVEGFGDVFIDDDDILDRGMGGAVTPIDDNKVLLIIGKRTTDEVENPEANIILTSYTIDQLGGVETHDLDQYVSNGTTQRFNGMTATAYNGDSYLTAWSQNTPELGYEIRMQRATQTGIILGPQVTVNENAGGDQIVTRSATLTNGNMVVTWLSPVEGEEAAFEIRARVVRPDGTFATDEMSLGGKLSLDVTEDSPNLPIYEVTPLNTNEVLVTWAETLSDGTDIKAMAFDANLHTASNSFSIASGDAADGIENLTAITLPDNRVVLGWPNNYASQGEREDTSHTVGFYPVGKE